MARSTWSPGAGRAPGCQRLPTTVGNQISVDLRAITRKRSPGFFFESPPFVSFESHVFMLCFKLNIKSLLLLLSS